MKAGVVLIVALGSVLCADPALATAAHRAPAAPATAHAVRVVPMVLAAPMVSRTGANRTSATVARTNGIAGNDFLKPVLRNAAGGASARSGVIDGGTITRRH